MAELFHEKGALKKIIFIDNLVVMTYTIMMAAYSNMENRTQNSEMYLLNPIV